MLVTDYWQAVCVCYDLPVPYFTFLASVVYYHILLLLLLLLLRLLLLLSHAVLTV